MRTLIWWLAFPLRIILASVVYVLTACMVREPNESKRLFNQIMKGDSSRSTMEYDSLELINKWREALECKDLLRGCKMTNEELQALSKLYLDLIAASAPFGDKYDQVKFESRVSLRTIEILLLQRKGRVHGK
jgi:hypothetical protein